MCHEWVVESVVYMYLRQLLGDNSNNIHVWTQVQLRNSEIYSRIVFDIWILTLDEKKILEKKHLKNCIEQIIALIEIKFMTTSKKVAQKISKGDFEDTCIPQCIEKDIEHLEYTVTTLDMDKKNLNFQKYYIVILEYSTTYKVKWMEVNFMLFSGRKLVSQNKKFYPNN